MSRRYGSVVPSAARALCSAVLALLAACGQKGPLVGVKPSPPTVAAEVAPDSAIAIPAAVPASAPGPSP
ncbi:MAG: lipoprotein [Rhizobacter sp.]|nr:lipoprotein [Rhizobacter sp.]